MTTRRDSERGYALLMVFLMAALVALALYQQLPRVAFESEREKEQLLIDRGEQYIRAIQLYYLANNRQYPTSIDDLEKREKRFLRRRYIDPYTGKDEWRIIHGNGTFLTDSLVQKPPDPNGSSTQSASNTSSSANTPADPQQPQVNAAVLQRPSDRQLVPPFGFPQPVIETDLSREPITLAGQTGNQPGGLPPITLLPSGQQGGAGIQSGLPPITLSNTTATPGAQGGIGGQIPGQVPGQIRPQQLIPGQAPAIPGQTANGPTPVIGIPGAVPPGFRIDGNGQLVPITGGFPNQQTPAPGQAPNPVNQPGANPGGDPGAPNTALNLINQLLTNPRQTPTAVTQSSGNQVGAIAGIASTHKGPSIKIYKDQTQYELWEFVFMPTAGGVPGGVPGGQGGGPNGGPGNGRGGPNQPGGQTGFGQGGQNGGFGQGGQIGFGGGGARGGPNQQGGFQTLPAGR